MDFIVGLPKSRGYEAVFIIVDRLSKYSHFVAIKHPYTPRTIAGIFVQKVVRYMVSQVQLLVIVIRCLLVFFGKSYLSCKGRSYKCHQHTTLNRMVNLRSLIGVWKRIYVVSPLNNLELGPIGFLRRNYGLIPLFTH